MRENINTLFSMRVRDFFTQILTVGLMLSVVLSGWRAISILPNTDHPVVVVISGSMEPGYYRGDILLLHNWQERFPVQAGEIVVYTLPGKDIPIVHRVIRVHQRESDGKRLFLTKGDNNQEDDRMLFPAGLEWIEEDMILGKTYAYIPYIGYVTVLFQENVIVKYATLGLLGFFLITEG